jgi:hypothetical protein
MGTKSSFENWSPRKGRRKDVEIEAIMDPVDMGIFMLGHVSKVQWTVMSCIGPEGLENWTKATVTIFLSEVPVSVPLNKMKKNFNKILKEGIFN